MKKNYCLISHTHWDREWYLPLENFRMRLVDLIDNLLDILDKDPNYRFHLDAQTIVLEDYLEIRPHKRAALEGHVTGGRILVGPWYVQNDFHLTSGEATVRNLMIGTKIAKSFGESMPIGYAADQFGLIAQLPQILLGFGLTEGVFGRGIDRH
ncbi:MAG: alpha-mannosidase, partial [Clostridia bacterium]|nr:alpha-mannosidase [Clostridia bacterium]